MPKSTAAWCCLSSALAISTANAGTIRHDVDLQTHIDYGDAMRLIGGITIFPSFGSGTAISDRWILTAAHVVAGVNEGTYVTFETDPHPDDPDIGDPLNPPLSGYFLVDQVAIHEYYDDALGPAGGFDIALLRLNDPITQYAPYDRFRGDPATNPELGRVATAVGFGATGTGITGYAIETGGFYRLAGDNVIDGIASDPRVIGEFVPRTVVDPITGQTLHFTAEQIASQFIMTDFDDPATDDIWTNDGLNPLGSPDPLALEYQVAPGDSGGPLLTLINGTYHVIGINSWIYGLPAPDGDGTDNASYGDLAGYLRVSMFNDWIDEVTGIPEPGTAGMLSGVVALILMRRRRAVA